MKTYSMVLLCALAGALGGCSGDVFHPTPADVTGMWSEEVGPTLVPGNSFLMALTDDAGNVTGTGSFAGEAGPFGVLVVAGSSIGASLHLRIVYVPSAVFPLLKPDTAYFDGSFATRDRVTGMLTRLGTAQPFSLVRARMDPP